MTCDDKYANKARCFMATLALDNKAESAMMESISMLHGKK